MNRAQDHPWWNRAYASTLMAGADALFHFSLTVEKDRHPTHKSSPKYRSKLFEWYFVDRQTVRKPYLG